MGADICKFRGLTSGNLVLSSNLVFLDFIDYLLKRFLAIIRSCLLPLFIHFPNFLFFLDEWFNKFIPPFIFFLPLTVLGHTKYIFSTLKKTTTETRTYTELLFGLEEKLLKISLKLLSFNFYNCSLGTKLLLVTMGSKRLCTN